MVSRVSIFIDGENISAEYAQDILSKAKQFGQVDLKRVYGNALVLRQWDKQPGVRVIHSGTGKNSADILLSIEAMKRVFMQEADVVVVASSDSDFGHLARVVVSTGVHFVGIGLRAEDSDLAQSCSEFIPIDQLRKAATELDRQIKAVIRAQSSDATGMPLVRFNGAIRKVTDVKISELPERSWRKYFEQRPQLFSVDEPSAQARVRFLPDGFV